MGIGVQSLVGRVPMMLGPLIGGWLITRDGWQKGVHEALLTCTVFAIATFIPQLFMSDDDAPEKTEDGRGRRVLGVFRAFPAPSGNCFSIVDQRKGAIAGPFPWTPSPLKPDWQSKMILLNLTSTTSIASDFWACFGPQYGGFLTSI